MALEAALVTDYHADPAPEPSLSSSIAHVLCTSSPLHAWTAHPRLNPDYVRAEEQKFDVGNAAHALLLEGVDRAVSLDFNDYRTGTAREARDAARAAGHIPLLAEQYGRVLEMVAAVRAQLEAFAVDPPLLADGQAEHAITWEENGVYLRAKLDWLRDDLRAIDDLKTTSRSAAPEKYAQRLYSTGGDIQAAFYQRAVRSLGEHWGEVSVPFRWIVCETSPPYAVSAITPAPDVLAVGESKVDWAIARWRELMSEPGPEGPWPGYPLEVVRAELPPWEETRWLERMETL